MTEKTDMAGKPKLTPVDDDQNDEIGEETSSFDEIPESWKTLDLERLAEEGWKPYKKKQGELEYIYLRFRKGGQDQQKSIGRFSEKRMDYLKTIFAPSKSTMLPLSQAPLMRSAIVKTIPSSVSFRAEVMQWYWWAAEKAQIVFGKELTFAEFLNDVVLSYFAEKNMYLAVQIGVSEQSVGIQ